jgi:hypothetical protein
VAHSNTVLSQIVRIFPRHEFQALANKYHVGQKFRSFSRWSQFVAMLTAQLTSRSSLRDVVDNLSAQANKLYHLGLKPFSRATLSRCNEKQPHTLYEELFQRLLARCQSMAPRNKAFKLDGKIYLLDASLVELTLSLFPWAKYQKTKGAAKLHVGLDTDGYLPAFVDLIKGKEYEIDHARELELPRGSYLVFDRGYTDYTSVSGPARRWGVFRYPSQEQRHCHTRQKNPWPQKPWGDRRPRDSVGQVARKFPADHLSGRRDGNHIPVRHQCLRDTSPDGSRSVQGALADRTLLQMDQAELESEELSGHLPERGEDPALDRLVLLSGAVISEVPVEDRSFVATYVANFTTQFVREARFDGTIQTTKSQKNHTNQPVTTHLKL